MPYFLLSHQDAAEVERRLAEAHGRASAVLVSSQQLATGVISSRLMLLNHHATFGWFLVTRQASRKVAELQAHPELTLSWSFADGAQLVCQARATLRQDKEARETCWSEYLLHT